MRTAPSQSTPRDGASFIRPVYPRKNSRLRAEEFFSAAAGRTCRKEVAQMKNIKPLLSILLLTGVLGLGTAGAEAQGIVSKVQLDQSGYCHLKFPAIQGRTLASAHPVLKDPASGDLIDFYGPCDHDPLGKEEVWRQTLDHRFRIMIGRE
jgi:hypothetical protein